MGVVVLLILLNSSVIIYAPVRERKNGSMDDVHERYKYSMVEEDGARTNREGDISHLEQDEFGGSWFDDFEDDSGLECSQNLSMSSGNISLLQYLGDVVLIDDFSTNTGFWNEVDPGNRLEIDFSDDNRIEYTSLSQLDTAYIYYDLGGYVGDFEMKFDVINNGGSNAQAVSSGIGVSSIIDPLSNWNEGIYLRFESPGGSARWGLHANNDHVTANSNYNYQQPYYCTLKRLGNEAYLDIYTNQLRTNLIWGLSLSGVVANNLRYIYPLCSWAGGHNYIANGWVDNIVFSVPGQTDSILSSGSIKSMVIQKGAGNIFSKLNIEKKEPTNTYINVSVLHASTNQTIPGYENLTTRNIDISNITAESIRLKAWFSGNGSATPSLDSVVINPNPPG